MEADSSTPLWQYVLDHVDRADPKGLAVAIAADGGDPAYRAALTRWNKLRDGQNRDAIAGISLLLAEAFDDHRAVDYAAREWPEPFPEEFAWRVFLRPASEPVRRAFAPKILEGLREWFIVHEDGDLPLELARAARTLRADDSGEVYLQLRRDIVEETAATIPARGEKVADELLIAAAAATPDRAEVRRCVLSYWGQEEPIDDVPTSEPVEGQQPASWSATCALIRRSSDAAFADRVIKIAHTHEDAWRATGFDAENYVRALEESVGNSADAKLLELARAQVPISGNAVRALAARRRRLAGVRPPLLKRLELVLQGMHVSGLMAQYDELPGPLARKVLAEQLDESMDALSIAHQVAEAFDISTGEELMLEWSSFASWAEENELPEPDPVPAAPPQRRNSDNRKPLFRRFFDQFGGH